MASSFLPLAIAVALAAFPGNRIFVAGDDRPLSGRRDAFDTSASIQSQSAVHV